MSIEEAQKPRRSKRRIDDEQLIRLWPTRLSDDELAARLGHGRGAIRRRAEALGLPHHRRAIWAQAEDERPPWEE